MSLKTKTSNKQTWSGVVYDALANDGELPVVWDSVNSVSKETVHGWLKEMQKKYPKKTIRVFTSTITTATTEITGEQLAD